MEFIFHLSKINRICPPLSSHVQQEREALGRIVVIHINGAVRADKSVAVIGRRCENGKGNIGHYDR